jgi:hypothetical protein
MKTLKLNKNKKLKLTIHGDRHRHQNIIRI